MHETRRIGQIEVGKRQRKDLGDIRSLADSIEAVGLLHAVVIDGQGRLIAGQRRLEAVKLLGWDKVPVRVVDLDVLAEGEWVENACRKDFAPSEVAAIARVLRPREEEKAARRQLGGLKQGDEPPVRANDHDGAGGRVRDLVARFAGVSGRTLDKIEAVVAAAEEDPEKYGRLVEEMDSEPRAVHRCFGKLQTMRLEDGERKPGRPAEERRARLDAATILHGDCRELLKAIPDASVDAVVSDPPYPEIDREYGRMSEADWLAMMKAVVLECRRVLKPKGSAMFVIQPNAEKAGRMRTWHLEFALWAAREWNLVQDAYWWNVNALPLAGADRRHKLLRPSVKWLVWLGPPGCFKNQENVLLSPAEDTVARAAARRVRRPVPSGIDCDDAQLYGTADERGGTTPFNCLPIASGCQPAGREDHPAATPYDLASWWCRYLLPPGGVLLDPFAGSGTVLAAGLDSGASRVIGMEKEARYVEIARRHIAG